MDLARRHAPPSTHMARSGALRSEPRDVSQHRSGSRILCAGRRFPYTPPRKGRWFVASDRSTGESTARAASRMARSGEVDGCLAMAALTHGRYTWLAPPEQFCSEHAGRSESAGVTGRRLRPPNECGEGLPRVGATLAAQECQYREDSAVVLGRGWQLELGEDAGHVLLHCPA